MVLRKLAVALLSVGVMLPGLGHALAVSDLKTKSALGEPFQAEVELSELGDLNADEIKISLATQEDFDRLGVDRVYFLTELKFDVVVNQGGRSFIRVSSVKPVREPYLDFVIRVAWPGNARLQEVTALLDPPVVSDTAAPELNQALSSAPQSAPVAAVSAPVAPVVAPVAVPEAAVTAEPPKPVLAPRPVVTPNTVAVPNPVRQAAPQPVPSVQADGYRTRSGDTMSKIAQQFRPGDASVSQTMVAIQRANPGAFANDNINQLKRGQVLNIPTESQIREVSAQEALASVRRQAESWRSSTAPSKPVLEAQQLNATAKAAAPVAAAPVAPKPEMKLLAAQTGKSGSAAAGKESAAATAADAKRLNENKAKAESVKADKEKLASKVGTLDTQVKANDKQIQVQNAKLAELQVKLKEEQAKKDAAKLKEEQSQKTAVAADAAAVDADIAAAAAVKTQAVPPAPVLASKPLPPVPAVKHAPVPSEEAAEEGLPLGLIGGVVGVLALLGAGGYFWNQKRRRDQEAEDAALAELESSDNTIGSDRPDSVFASNQPHNDLAEGEDSWLGEIESEPVAIQDRVLADPLEEVEQYLAFERYPQAVGFLNKAIAGNPDRSDLRLKLLEVYAHLDDHHGFAEQEAWFEEAGDLQALSRAEELKAGMTPPPRVTGKDDAIDFERSLVAEEDDLPSLDDLEMDFNATVSASSPSLPAVKETDLDLPSLDDDFNFDSAELASPGADSGLSLDETLDFSFTKPAEKTAEPAFDDDLSFELDTDAFDEKPVASAEVHAADEGMDFSLDDEVVASPESGSSAGLGLGDLADFDMDSGFNEPELKAPDLKSSDDDLSFSLDDLEAESGSVDLDGDFTLDDGKGGAADFSFDETLQTDSGLNDVVTDFDSTLRAADVAPAAARPAPAPVAEPAADLGMDDEFDFLADTDENATKLDLARAYIDMGDMEGARDILQEVLSEGNSTQKDEAKGLIAQVG